MSNTNKKSILDEFYSSNIIILIDSAKNEASDNDSTATLEENIEKKNYKSN